MAKVYLDENDLQQVNGGANLIYAQVNKETFWSKLRRFFIGKNKSEINATVETVMESAPNFDLNKSPMDARNYKLVADSQTNKKA